MYHILLCLFWISKSWARNEIDYCKINKDHILCGADVPPSNISNVLRYEPKSKEHRQDLLNAINKMRNLAASGGFRIGNVSFPTARNMYELATWICFQHRSQKKLWTSEIIALISPAYLNILNAIMI
ncbi:UNVERIFIED_CONTAM: hypothetical protein RMT77_017928 [Armadillidium vulgare]